MESYSSIQDEDIRDIEIVDTEEMNTPNHPVQAGGKYGPSRQVSSLRNMRRIEGVERIRIKDDGEENDTSEKMGHSPSEILDVMDQDYQTEK